MFRDRTSQMKVNFENPENDYTLKHYILPGLTSNYETLTGMFRDRTSQIKVNFEKPEIEFTLKH
jgi:hypothetical protein